MMSGSRVRFRIVVGSAVPLLVLLSSCASEAPPPEAIEGSSMLGAADVPLPDLSAMDPAVAAQIRERYDAVLYQLEDPNSSGRDLARAFGELGAVYRAYRLLPLALTCYRAAVDRDPQDVRWIYMMAHVERSRGNLEESNQSFLRALEFVPNDVPTLIWLGENALDEDRLESADEYFVRALEHQPNNVKALVGRGRIALSRNTLEAAVEHLEDALALQERATPIHYSLGLAWSRLGEHDKARSYFDRIPDDDRARVQVAFHDPLMQEVKDLRASAQSFALRAQTAISQQRYDDAVRELEQAVEIDPARADTRYNLAASLLLLNRRYEARAHLEQLVRRNPDYVQGYLLFARLLSVSGELTRAEGLLLRASELDPEVAAGPLAAVRAQMTR